MTEDQTTGVAVREQAADNSFGNTDPALARGAVVGVVTAIGSILVLSGLIDEDQKQALADNAGVLVPAVLAIAAIVQAVWTRASVWSPRTAARGSVASARTGVPTLDAPP